MKILKTDYKVKCPLDEKARVSLCEEETEVCDGKSKKDLVINKLFLMTDSGIRFSNYEIESENRKRIEKAKEKKHKKQQKIKNA